MRRALLASVAAVLWLPVGADAATVSYVPSRDSMYDALQFSASKGERNRVSVQVGSRLVVIKDRGAGALRIARGPDDNCRREGRRTAVCRPERFRVLRIAVALRDGDDSVSVSGGSRNRETDGALPSALVGERPRETGSKRRNGW